MNNKQCKQDIYYLYGLYVYMTYVHICIHVEIKVVYLHFLVFVLLQFARASKSLIRLMHKSFKSSRSHRFISQYITDFIDPMFRDINPSSN